MLTDNNQIFRNCFVIIYCHLTNVSSQINKCIIFERNELSITLSTLWCSGLWSGELRQTFCAGRFSKGAVPGRQRRTSDGELIPCRFESFVVREVAPCYMSN